MARAAGGGGAVEARKFSVPISPPRQSRAVLGNPWIPGRCAVLYDIFAEVRATRQKSKLGGAILVDAAQWPRWKEMPVVHRGRQRFFERQGIKNDRQASQISAFGLSISGSFAKPAPFHLGQLRRGTTSGKPLGLAETDCNMSERLGR